MSARIEKDTMGELTVPEEALYGAQTARAVENFPISGSGIGREMIRALGLIKKAAAVVNREIGRLDPETLRCHCRCGRGGGPGEPGRSFPGRRLPDRLGHQQQHERQRGDRQPGDPDARRHGRQQVARSSQRPRQHGTVEQRCLPHGHPRGRADRDRERAAAGSRAPSPRSCATRAERFDDIVKIGRTHLQDATPIRLGQEFSGFASQVEHGIQHLTSVSDGLRELPIGGTAVGTGINTHPEFGREDGRRALADDRHQLRGSRQPLRGSVGPGRRGSDQRSPQVDCGEPDQDRRSHPLARLRSSPGSRRARDSPPCSPARASCLARSIR